MVSLTVADGVDRTPLKNQRPQTPPLKKENPCPAAPGERYEE